MAIVNSKKVLIGALAGWVAWVVWSGLINMVMLAGRYADAQESGALLTEGRYPFFLPVYFLALLGISYILAWMYAGMRGCRMSRLALVSLPVLRNEWDHRG